MHNRNLTKWFVTAGVSLALAGAYLTVRTFLAGPPSALPAGDVLPVATRVVDEHPLPGFRLLRAQGHYTEADLSGQWTFMFFGYTQCPDVCPTTLAAMKRVMQEIGKSGLPLPRVVFVSVDPKRDTPELLGEFVSAFDPRFVGVTGQDTDLEPLTRSLGVRFARHDGLDPKTYTVDHTTHLYLVGPDRRVRSVFSFPHHEEAIARAYAQITRP